MGISTDYVPTNLILSLFEEGYVGVSLFMCITGFIFTVLTHDKDIQFLPFLRNRFLRLFPLIFLITLFGVSTLGASQDSMFTFFNLLGGGVIFGTWRRPGWDPQEGQLDH